MSFEWNVEKNVFTFLQCRGKVVGFQTMARVFMESKVKSWLTEGWRPFVQCPPPSSYGYYANGEIPISSLTKGSLKTSEPLSLPRNSASKRTGPVELYALEGNAFLKPNPYFQKRNQKQ